MGELKIQKTETDSIILSNIHGFKIEIRNCEYCGLEVINLTKNQQICIKTRTNDCILFSDINEKELYNTHYILKK